jgi:basic amino acid/polyamine antiporter, APA family
MSQGPQHVLQRKIGLFSTSNLVMANMVGTGIFTTSSFIMGKVKDPKTLLLCWRAGGMLALSRTLCYAELGTNFHQAGGKYAFLRHSFGPAIAFFSGWISLTVGFSASISAAPIAFSTCLWQIIGPENVSTLVHKFDGITILTSSIKEGIAIGVIPLLTLFHYFGLTLIKLGIIGILICAGFFMGQGELSKLKPLRQEGSS